MMNTEKKLTMTFATKDNPHSGKPSVPFDRWGHDHWATFAFLECRAVDTGGVIDIQRMRCDNRIHPGLANRANRMYPNSHYPTILKDGSKVEKHDDWSCFEDLIAMGLCTWEGTGINPIVKFTDKGRKLAGLLRAHKSAGGQFKNFDPGTFWAEYGHEVQSKA
jgi:hypothetical protein